MVEIFLVDNPFDQSTRFEAKWLSFKNNELIVVGDLHRLLSVMGGGIEEVNDVGERFFITFVDGCVLGHKLLEFDIAWEFVIEEEEKAIKEDVVMRLKFLHFDTCTSVRTQQA